MPHAVFTWPHIAGTAVACALVAALVLAWRARRGGVTGAGGGIVGLAAVLGLVVFAWRAASNALLLNDDFVPAVSVADVGSGVLALLWALALAPLRPGGPRRAGRLGPAAAAARGAGASPRAWALTGALVALAIFLCNVALI
ncbi:MAG TPA: hypothetical protein VFL91_00270 [Thermomicrobiales bacterium]|nr:hypothetical protein [Thermomicrobiales bacterium]